VGERVGERAGEHAGECVGELPMPEAKRNISALFN
jgi:hypothetical protein